MGGGRWEERGLLWHPPSPIWPSSLDPAHTPHAALATVPCRLGLSHSVSSQVRRVSPGVCVRGPREGKKGGGEESREGVGVRGGRGRAEEGRARGARGRLTAAVAAAAVRRESPKRRRTNNLPWRDGLRCDGCTACFATGAFVGAGEGVS